MLFERKYLIFSDNKLVNENNGKKGSLYFSRIIDDLLPVNSIFVGYSTESENLNTPFDVSNLENGVYFIDVLNLETPQKFRFVKHQH